MITASTSLRAYSSSLLRTGVGTVSAELLNEGRAFIAAAVPDVGDGDDLEVDVLCALLERGQIAAFHAVAAADDAHAHAIVRAQRSARSSMRSTKRRRGQRCATRFQKSLRLF
jgi:hypothetical protein